MALVLWQVPRATTKTSPACSVTGAAVTGGAADRESPLEDKEEFVLCIVRVPRELA